MSGKQRARGRKPTLTRYIEARLGKAPATQAKNVLAKPFGAGSFIGFWRYWNPVYGYFLLYYSYRPLRKVLPRGLAVWLTFILCGLVLHDAVGWALGRRVRFPELTLLFAVFGLGALAGEAVRMDLSRSPVMIRAVANVAYLAVSILIWWCVLHVALHR
jgi:hypothetical protein